MRRLAVIPARGGSKRIPHKNIRDFCGEPMIVHVLRAARDSRMFSAIHVSTENEAIRNVATAFGCPPDFPRPAELADDQTPIMPVLRYVVMEYGLRGQHFDEVWLLMACAPLLAEADLRKAAEMMGEAGGVKSLLAVSEYPVPIEWAFSRNAAGGLTPIQPGMFAKSSQDLEKRYFDAGCFAAFPSTLVQQSEGAGSDEDFIGYVLSKDTAIDIDDEQDWRLAEAMYRARKSRKGHKLWRSCDLRSCDNYSRRKSFSRTFKLFKAVNIFN